MSKSLRVHEIACIMNAEWGGKKAQDITPRKNYAEKRTQGEIFLNVKGNQESTRSQMPNSANISMKTDGQLCQMLLSWPSRTRSKGVCLLDLAEGSLVFLMRTIQRICGNKSNMAIVSVNNVDLRAEAISSMYYSGKQRSRSEHIFQYQDETKRK